MEGQERFNNFQRAGGGGPAPVLRKRGTAMSVSVVFGSNRCSKQVVPSFCTRDGRVLAS